MAVLGIILCVVGIIVSLVGGIWFLVVAFRESILWGLLCLFISFCSVIFLVMHWEESWRPFFLSFGGGVIAFIGIMIAASGGTT
jgi:hypothetical protein